jgi:MFS family permease
VTLPAAPVARRPRPADLLARLLPPPGPLRSYSAITLAAAVGTGMFVTGSAAFFIRYAGLSTVEVGAGLTVAGLLGLAASVPAGMLGDRYGHRRVLVVIHLLRAVAFGLYVLVSSFPLFAVLVSLIALADCAEPPNRRAYLSAISSPEQRVRANAYNRTVFNIGFAAGSAGAGVVLAANVTPPYAAFALGNALAYLVAAVVMSRLPAVGATAPAPATAPATTSAAAPAARRRNALLSGPFMVLSLVVGALYMHQPLLSIGLPLWVLERTSAPAWVLAFLMLTNTGLVIALQVPLSRGGETASGSARLARWAGLVLLGGCLLWGLAADRSPVWAVGLLVAGMALVTLGEIWCSVASWGLSYALAPENAQGEFLGAWSTGVQLMQAFGPVLFAAPLLGLGLVGWLGIGVAFALVGTVTVPLAGWARERMRPPQPATADATAPATADATGPATATADATGPATEPVAV